MSNIALSWAFKCHVGNASAKAVLVYLADRADDDGTAAYPKIATIVNVTELSERTVRTALKTLQERDFIRRGDQRYARLGKGGRNRLPQYCQIVWDLAVETDPSTLKWIGETHTAERDPATMGKTVDPEAGTVFENGESEDVLPENVGTKPIPSTANLAGLEKGPEPALQIPQGQHCESCTPSTANAAPPALQISQSCIYKDKTLQVNPPSKPSFPSAPTGHLPAGGATPARDEKNDDGTTIVLDRLAAVRSRLSLSTATPTGRDRDRVSKLVDRVTEAHDGDHAAALTLILAVIDWLPANTYWLSRADSPRRLAADWDRIANDWTISELERRREHDAAARDRDRRTDEKPTPCPLVYRPAPHTHTFACQHVLEAMKPHWDEYDHEGSYRTGNPSEWQLACQRLADELNRRDGVEPVGERP